METDKKEIVMKDIENKKINVIEIVEIKRKLVNKVVNKWWKWKKLPKYIELFSIMYYNPNCKKFTIEKLGGKKWKKKSQF